MDDLLEKYRIEVDKGQAPLRIDKYLTEHIAGVSRNRIQTAADNDLISVNGKSVKSNYKVKPLDDIRVLLDHEPTDTHITPENIPIEVVYEDEDVMVINKQAGLVVHPGHGNYEHTLLHALAYYFQQKNTSLDINNPEIGLVHRIDKDTSGLLLIAKTPDAKTKLGMQFFEHTTERTYQALVWGTFKETEGTVTGALARDLSDRTKYRIYSLEDNPDAKEAVTHWRVVETFPYVTLVECRLETGRTHQIRVHMQSLGHPLFSDEKYGGTEILKGLPTQKYKQFIHNCFMLCPRQVLHAKTLGFTHPVTGERLLFDSELPEDITNLLNKWRNYGNIQTDIVG
ncbi:MAG: RluA family pseudouridine synthase [Paludibacteraceae bacterium]|nr:RluA family pseudouridine synthase [Paludibacteraceae bacterium]